MENNNQDNNAIIDNAETINQTNNNAAAKQTDDELALSYLEVRCAIRRMGHRREFWTGRRY